MKYSKDKRIYLTLLLLIDTYKQLLFNTPATLPLILLIILSGK